VRTLYWINILVVAVIWLMVADELRTQTYDWWADVQSTSLAHSPWILLLLPFLLITVIVLAIDAWVIGSRLMSKARVGPFYGWSGALLLIGLTVSIWVPKDTLNAATVAVLGPGDRGNVLLYNSIAMGRIKTAKALLDAGVSLPSDESIVYIGATFGQPEVIAWGLARGEDPNAVGRKGYTPIASAIANEQSEAIEYLLATGVTPSEMDKERISSLLKKRNVRWH
jgi:hypothetical protein